MTTEGNCSFGLNYKGLIVEWQGSYVNTTVGTNSSSQQSPDEGGRWGEIKHNDSKSSEKNVGALPGSERMCPRER